MRKFGLIGKKLEHSFSKRYFSDKFEKEGIAEAEYELYEMASIEELPALLKRNSELAGLNVTVPYKEAVLPYLDELDDAVVHIGAVNTIQVKGGRTKGFNTDYIGFRDSLKEFYPLKAGNRALILGTGGASKAVGAALSGLNISYTLVSRRAGADAISYKEVTPVLLQGYDLIINTTPLGMQPDVASFPPLPYEALTSQHYLYDLVYNPERTAFLEHGSRAGSHIKNGLDMLYRQAEAAWNIWNGQ